MEGDDPTKNVKVIFIISGRRNSGKDYVAKRFLEAIINRGSKCLFWSGSIVVKREFCAHKGHDLNRMLTDRDYKDSLREDLTHYFQTVMAVEKSPDYCNLELIEDIKKNIKEPTCFVFDIRYPFEIECYERHNFNLVKIRINASEETKKKRGWVYDPKLDEDKSETGLNDYVGWDYVFNNDKDGVDNIDLFVKDVLDKVKI